MMETNGTVSRITLSRVSNPLVLLSSKLKTLQDSTAKIKVYTTTILFLSISKTINLIILFNDLLF